MIGRRPGPPRLGVRSDGPAPPGLVTLLALARRWCTIVLLTAGPPESEGPVDAVLAVGADLIPTGGGPVAVWVESVDDMGWEKLAGADVVLSAREDVVARAGGRGLLVPAGMLETSGSPPEPVPAGAVPVAPYVRARLRKARGLPDPLVIEHGGEGWAQCGSLRPLEAALGVTALACASAAVVSGPALLDALAWGTPCATDVETASRFGARPDSDVLVAGSVDARRRAAMELATDETLAARISWAGRRLVETHHSPAAVAATLVRRLGLGAASRVPAPPPLGAALADLDTPERAAIVDRVRVATAVFDVAGD